MALLNFLGRSSICSLSSLSSNFCALNVGGRTNRNFSSSSWLGIGKTTHSDFGIEHICRGIGRSTDMIVERSKGSFIWDEDQNKYLDFTSGIGVCNVGYCHPRIVSAIQEQANHLIHSQVNVALHRPMLNLMEKMLKVMPDKSLDTFFFWNSGAEAVEGSIKLARQATKKQNIIVFQGSYHGRTIGTMSLTTSKTIYRQKFGPLMPGVFVTPYPYRSQLPKNIGTDDDMAEFCLDALKHVLMQQTHPEETAALLAETVLGEGGYLFPPDGFLNAVKDICDKNGILFISDEVQCGYGRTGKMFAVEHYGLTPDILVSAKGLASGSPLSVVISRKELMDTMVPGTMGGTYAGNAISCAAASATLDIFEEENLLDNCNQRGEQFLNRLHKMKGEGLPIKDIRGKGLMIATEFDSSIQVSSVVQECANRGLILLSASIFNTIRFIPPLTVSEAEIDQACDILYQAIKAAKE